MANLSSTGSVRALGPLFDACLHADALESLVGQLSVDLAEIVAAYLERCPRIAPWTGVETDVLGGAFTVIDGASWCSDGAWLWRLDTAAYVRAYHLGLPAAFLASGAATGWAPPTLTAVTETDLWEAGRRLRSKDA